MKQKHPLFCDQIARECQESRLLSADVSVTCNNKSIKIYFIHFPPKNYFKTLGPRFLVGGYFNVKHPWWGSRLIKSKGRELHKTILANNFRTISEEVQHIGPQFQLGYQIFLILLCLVAFLGTHWTY